MGPSLAHRHFPGAFAKHREFREILAQYLESGSDWERGDALLAAALETGKNVLFALRHDIGNRPELISWYDAEAAARRDPANSALPWLNEARVASTKRGGVGIVTRLGATGFEARNLTLRGGQSFSFDLQGRISIVSDQGTERESREVVTLPDGESAKPETIFNPMPPDPLLLGGVDLTGLPIGDILGQYSGFLLLLLNRGGRLADQISARGPSPG